MDAYFDPRMKRMNGHQKTTKTNGTNGHHGPNGHSKMAELVTKPKPVEEVSESRSRIEWVESLGLFVLHDESVIQRANRRFCSRVIDVLIRSRKVRLAHVHMENHEFVVQFTNPKTDRAEAARILGEAVRLAAMPIPSGMDDESVMSPRWTGLTAFASENGLITSWRTRELGKNRLRIYGESLNRPESDPAELLLLIPSLKSIHRRWLSSGVTVRFDSEQIRALDLVGAIDTIFRLEAASLLPDENENPLASTSLVRRAWHLSLAGGSFAGAIVGLIVPGIPTVPFVLLTSYHLAKGSATINRYFLRMPLFGSLAHDWSDGHYIRPINKFYLITITSGIIAVTLSVTTLTPGILVAVGTVFVITTFSVLQTPSEPQMGMVPKVGISRGLRSLPAMG